MDRENKSMEPSSGKVAARVCWRQGIAWGCIVVMAVAIFLMNIYCVPAFDELMYAFGGMGGETEAGCPRIASVMDVVRQQIGDYVEPGGNGRVWIHGLVAIFAGFRLYTLFDVCNTAMWFFLVWALMREGHVPIRTPWRFALGAAVVWWLLWYAESCSMNAAFAVNYLWTGVATVCMMALWRRLTRWGLVPIAFLYGWSQEAFVLPMVVALAGGALARCVAARRVVVSVRQVAAWGLMVAGAAFLCLSPALLARAGGQVAYVGLGPMVLAVARMQATVWLLLGPLTLLLGLLVVAWCNRGAWRRLFMRKPEWWCYLMAAFGWFTVLAASGASIGIRVAMPMLVAATVLLFRERQVFRPCLAWLRRGGDWVVLVWVLLWLGGGTWTQIVAGREIMDMLARYRNDSQGVTWLPPSHLGIFQYVAFRSYVNAQDRMCFQREFACGAPLTLLPQWLYLNLYENPKRYFAAAHELEKASGLFVSERMPFVVVKCGDSALSSHQVDILANYHPQVVPKEGLDCLIPGRFKIMWSDESSVLGISRSGTTFTAKNGHVYSLFPVK